MCLLVVAGVDFQHLQLRGGLPAHGDFHTPVAVHVDVVDTVNRGAGTLYPEGLAVGIVLGAEDVDFQGLFVGGVAEERDRFLSAVAVEVDELYGLDIRAGRGRGVLRAAAQNFGEQTVQLGVLGGEFRERVQLLRVEREAGAVGTAGQRKEYQQQCRREAVSGHSKCLLSGVIPVMIAHFGKFG